MATSEQIEKIRAALAELNGALNAAKDGGEEQSGVRTLAAELDGSPDTKEYLGEDGLRRLVELLKERIAAVDGDGKYLPLTGGTVTGATTFNAQVNFPNGAYLDTSGHIHLPSGVEIY